MNTLRSPSEAVVLAPDDSPTHPLAQWFEDARRRRREHYAHPPPRPRRATRAVITIVHNESVFLPIWLRYYSRFYAPEDIYVLDNDSSDESIASGGFVRIPVEHPSVDHVWMVQTIESLQHELIERYDSVLVTDVDEIVALRPALGTLGDYLDRFDEEWVNCLGYELLHLRDTEPPLALDRPILAQRGHWYFNGAYDKPALATTPMSWKPGFHGRSDSQFNVDPDLRLIHLHRMDYDICLERHRVRNRRPWAERDARKRWAVHNQITDEAAFARWFYEDSSVEYVAVDPEPIPVAWRELF
jgi:hypothetical protein